MRSRPVTSATYDLSPAVARLLRQDGEQGHVHVLSAFRTGLGDNPRQQLGLLYRLGHHNRLVVQANEEPAWPGKLGEFRSSSTVAHPSVGETVDIAVAHSCLKTPLVHLPLDLRDELERKGPDGKKVGRAYRSRAILVPEADREAWARRRLVAAGLDPVSIHLGSHRYIRLGSARRGMPFVEIVARARVVDAERFAAARVNGLGKGRNYGLGLIQLNH